MNPLSSLSLKAWIDYYGVQTYVDEIIFAIQTMALDEKSAIVINPSNSIIKER